MKETKVRMEAKDVKIYEEMLDWIGVEKEDFHRFDALVDELLKTIVKRRDPSISFHGWGCWTSVDVDQTIIVSEPDGDDVEIVGNNCTIHEWCPICGGDHKSADVPFWIALKDTKDMICNRCAEALVPTMLTEVRKRNAEEWGGKENCPNCGAKLGEVHRDLCDIELCTVCGGQRLSCGCEHNSDRETWAGELV